MPNLHHLTGSQHRRTTPVRSALMLVFMLVLMSGCVTLPNPQTGQVQDSEVVLVLEPGHRAGQSFISNRPGLSQVSFWVRTSQSVDLQVALYHQAGDAQPIFKTSWTARDGQNTITLAPLESHGYYLELSAVSAPLELLGRAEDVYAAGRADHDGSPLAADLAFSTGYAYDFQEVLVDLGTALAGAGLLLPLSLVLLLPGWWLLEISGLRSQFDFGSRLALALAVSLSLVALLLAWSSWLNLRWTATTVWIAALLPGLHLSWRVFRRVHWHTVVHHPISNAEIFYSSLRTLFSPKTLRLKITTRGSINWHSLGFNLLLVLVFLAAWLVRAAMVRDLAAPAWVDPVHHGLITRLIMESGRLPQDLSAYQLAGIERYHPGFHSSLAAFLTLARLDLPAGMLLFGQVLNALMVFPTYLFARTLTGRRLSGLLAAVLVAFFLPLPAYYASWGRYTQLAGLLILPAGLAFWQAGQENGLLRRTRIRLLLLAGLTLAGLFLAHYRVTAFLAVLLPFYWLLQTPWRKLGRSLSQLGAAIALSLALALPWLLPTLQELLIPKTLGWQPRGQEWVEFSTRLLTPGAGQQAIYLAAAGLLLAGLLRQRFALTLPLWVLALWTLANLGALGLPNPGFVNALSVEIMLFLPLAVLGGYAIDQLISTFHALLPKRAYALLRAGLLATGAAACLWGAQQMLPLLNPVTFLFREADRPAIAWIAENLPDGEPILINPTGWGYGVYMGADGGFWISALSNHPTYPPPVIYGSGHRQQRTEMNQFIEQVSAAGQDAEQIWQSMRSQAINYLYIGARGGQFSAQKLEASEHFELLYNEQDTWLFRARP